MEPAHTIIQKLGGVTSVASIAGVHRTRVSNWMRPKTAGGTGGTVPQKHILTLLAVAKDRGVELTPADFFPPGATPATPALAAEGNPCAAKAAAPSAALSSEATR